MELRDPARGRQSVIIFAIVALVLQVALGPQISIFGGRVNFLLAFAGAQALSGDTNRSAYVGFFCGLFYDLTAPVPIGLMALIMTVSTFLLSSIVGMAGSGLTGRSVQYLAIYGLSVSLVYGLILFLMGVEGDFVAALFGRGLLTAVLSVAVSLVFVVLMGSFEGGGRAGFSHRRGSRFKQVR